MAAKRRAPAAGEPRQQHLTVEHLAARALLDARTIDEAAPKILQAICEAVGWAHGALWVLDREAGRLRCARIWNPPDVRFHEFDAISRTLTFARGVGLPGRVWATGQPAWIPDVSRDSNFPRGPVAAREGLHAAFGFPITLRGEVLSVMEFFSRAIHEPDQALLATLTSVGNQIGLFIERRRAQDELDRFFTLSLDMLCVAGFDGYFKRVNPAWQRQLGWTEQELLSRPYVELIHPDDVEATRAVAGTLAEGRDVVYFENRYLHKDGTHRWLLWAATPLASEQTIYATGRDITERKAAEATMEELVRALEVSKRRAEDAADTKSAFLANMSHEIRTPLNAILGMTSLALQTRLSEEQRDYLSTVKSSGEALLGVINDVLDFSKIEARRLDLEHTPFDLRETVDDASRMFALRAAQKGIELACDVAADVPEQVVGDSGRLRQVLLNILGNAVKFTDRGEVVLRVTLDDSALDHVRLLFSVSDTGIGIAADKLAHIFQAFTQADSSTTRRFGGTGLGLAIAERLVELMNGRLWVESRVDHGSTFHFTVAFGRQAEIAGAGRDARGLAGLRVLVVDDNATNRRILQQMLASWQMAPTTVPDARSALAALRQASMQDRFDAVIADCQMPDVDGFMLARQIKADAGVRATPVVMLTSMGRAEDVAECRKIGLQAYLTKPVKQSDLLDTLVSLFGASVRPLPDAALAGARAGGARRRLKILVAEDNAVNRYLATTVLTKRGHAVHAVEDGRAAVDAEAAAEYDLVVMDLQMPRMGGLEATRAIRDRERRTGGHIPIVALTAHAMQGDRERCLDAGMDGYLTKPIDTEELVATIERLGGPSAARPSGAAGAPGRPPRPSTRRAVFDEAAALAATGDRKLLKRVVALFRPDASASLRRIDRAIAARDAAAVRMAAHALKGSAGAVGAVALGATAAALESVAASGRLHGAATLAARLRRELVQLEAALQKTSLIVRRRPAGVSKRGRRPPQSRTRRRS